MWKVLSVKEWPERSGKQIPKARHSGPQIEDRRRLVGPEQSSTCAADILIETLERKATKRDAFRALHRDWLVCVKSTSENSTCISRIALLQIATLK
jgi:hypothetical protein